MESYEDTVRRLGREKAEREAAEQRLQNVIAAEAGATLVFRALNQLTLRGYKPELETENFADAIWLYHPSAKASYPTLILYPAGYIVGLPTGAGQKELRILLEERQEFDAFLRSVPHPGFWDRIRQPFLLTLYGVVLVALSWWLGDVFEYVINRLASGGLNG